MSRVRRDIEAMADLLLGASPEQRPDRVTALIDGNLPSRGDAWRSAAAELIAGQHSGTYILSRFGELDAASVGASAQQVVGSTLSAMFETASPGHHWIISTGHDVDGATLAGVDEITLVTGVDEAAIVAAYALLKQLLVECPGRLPNVSLVLAGTSSMAAGDRFVRTARARLGVEPTVLGCLPQADGVHRQWQRMSMPEGGVPALLSMLVAAAGSRSTATGERPEPIDAATQPNDANTSSPAGCELHAATPVAASAPQPPPLDQPPPLHPQPGHAHNVAPSRPLPDGFAPLAVVCPWAPKVVFATHINGTVHAVAPASLLADLVAAIGWAAEHAAMLPGNGPVQGHVLVGDVHAAAVLRAGPWPVHLVIEGPQGPVVLPAQDQSLSQGPSAGTVPGWSPNQE
jgi:hypothetical protein